MRVNWHTIKQQARHELRKAALVLLVLIIEIVASAIAYACIVLATHSQAVAFIVVLPVCLFLVLCGMYWLHRKNAL